MYIVQRGDQVVAIPDTDPRWRAMSRAARMQFIEGRLEHELSDEEAFDGLGLPVTPIEDARWDKLSEAQQVEFLSRRITGSSEEEAFADLGHAAPPEPDDPQEVDE